MQVKTILNRLQSHPSFVYERVRLVEGEVPRLEVDVRARANSRQCCSAWERAGPGYDTLPARRAWMTGMLPHGVLLTLFAIAVAAAGWRSLATADRLPPVAPISGRPRIAIGATVGGAAGFIGGLLGLGGGLVVAPMLMELGYPAKQAAATTAFIVTFSSFSGFVGHMAEGRIDLTLAAVSVASVVAGSQLGASFMAKKAKPAWVKKAYGLVLLAVAAQLAYGLLRR